MTSCLTLLCCVGLWTGEHGTTTVTQKNLAKPTGTFTIHKTKLPTNHGTFVTMVNYDTMEPLKPLDRSTERTIGIVSVAFTLATASAFLLALSCLFRDRFRTCCRKTAKKRRSWNARQNYFKTTRKISGFLA